MKASGGTLLCFVACFASACGTASPYDFSAPDAKEPSLLTTYGSIRSNSGVAELFQAALVWLPASAGKPLIPQEVAVLFFPPAGIQIDVSKPPPDGALDGGLGRAELLFYKDGDGNRLLNVREPGEASPDRVLGRAPDVRFWWSASSAAMQRTETSTFGYSACEYDPTASRMQRRCDQPDNSRAVGSSPETAIGVVLSNEEVLQSYTCKEFLGSDEFPDDTPGWNSPTLKAQICRGSGCACNRPDCPLVAPDGESSCELDKTGDRWKACVSDPSLCGTRFCHYLAGEIAQGQPLPSQSCP